MEISNKTWLWIVIAVVVLALFWIAWQYGFLTLKTEEQSQFQPLSGGDTTAEIDDDLNAIDVGNPDQDFEQIDADINSL